MDYFARADDKLGKVIDPVTPEGVNNWTARTRDHLARKEGEYKALSVEIKAILEESVQFPAGIAPEIGQGAK